MNIDYGLVNILKKVLHVKNVISYKMYTNINELGSLTD